MHCSGPIGWRLRADPCTSQPASTLECSAGPCCVGLARKANCLIGSRATVWPGRPQYCISPASNTMVETFHPAGKVAISTMPSSTQAQSIEVLPLLAVAGKAGVQ